MSIRLVRSTLLNSSSQKRIAYSLAAGALAGATPAEAVVVYSGIENLSIAERSFQPFKFDNDQYIDAQLKNFVDPYIGLTGNFQGVFMPYSPGAVVGFTATNGLNYVSALSAGVFVDQSTVGPFTASMAFGSNHPNAEFNLITNAYIGLGFPISGDDSSGNHFGWIRVSVDNANRKFILHDWAYESDPEVGITTGDKGDAGDFNDDGVVDAQDYVVWRKTVGTNFILAGHGDENGSSLNIVDHDDYTLWAANFGHVSPVATGAGVAPDAVPEPITLGLLATGSVGLLALRRARRGK